MSQSNRMKSWMLVVTATFGLTLAGSSAAGGAPLSSLGGAIAPPAKTAAGGKPAATTPAAAATTTPKKVATPAAAAAKPAPAGAGAGAKSAATTPPAANKPAGAVPPKSVAPVAQPKPAAVVAKPPLPAKVITAPVPAKKTPATWTKNGTPVKGKIKPIKHKSHKNKTVKASPKPAVKAVTKVVPPAPKVEAKAEKPVTEKPAKTAKAKPVDSGDEEFGSEFEAQEQESSTGPWLIVLLVCVVGGVGGLVFLQKRKTQQAGNRDDFDYKSTSENAFGSDLSSLDIHDKKSAMKPMTGLGSPSEAKQKKNQLSETKPPQTKAG